MNFFTRMLPKALQPTNEGSREVQRGPGGSTLMPSSFGAADTTFGLPPETVSSQFDAIGLFNGDRARELTFRASFYKGTLHDWKAFDMDGSQLVPSGRPGSGGDPFLATAPSAEYVPLSQRRPNSPYRLARTIVRGFTGMLYGHNRWPQIRSDDPDTQAFCEAVVKAANIRNRMIRARNIAGACGTAGLSWFFRNGAPRVRVHGGPFIHVLEWDDVDDFVPKHVVELYQSTATRVSNDGQATTVRTWIRKDWTETADIVFLPVEVMGQNPTRWDVDEQRSYSHGDGYCHFIWYQNYSNDDEPGAVDGEPDYAELYEQLATLDGINSLVVRGVAKNIDPTLVVRTDEPEMVRRSIIKKGSDNAFVVPTGGGAEYLTLEEGVVNAGTSLIDKQREQVLEVSQCVVLDPDKVAAAGLSSVSQKLMYAPMVGAADLLREPGGVALVRLLEQMRDSAARSMGSRDAPIEIEEEASVDDVPVDVEEPSPESGEGAIPIEGLPPIEREPVKVRFFLALPPRAVSTDELDEAGAPTGRQVVTHEDIHPGSGKIELEWGEYFPPTMDDRQKNISAVSQAVGSKPVLSQRTGVELTSGMLNKDSAQEWERVSDERRQGGFQEGGDPGGAVEHEHELPGGADVPVPADSNDVQKLALNGAQIASLVEIVSQVARGDIPRESGIEILGVAFPQISVEEAAAIIDKAGTPAFNPGSGEPVVPA